MGFLDKRLDKQNERIIAEHGVPGEVALIRELVVDEDGMVVKHPLPARRRMGVLATTWGLYFEVGGQVLSTLPYHSIAYAAALTRETAGMFPECLEVVSHDGARIRMSFPMRDGGLATTVQERLLRLEPYEASHTLSTGHEVTFRYSPWRPDTMSYWIWAVPGLPAPDETPRSLRNEVLAAAATDAAIVGLHPRQGSVAVAPWRRADDWEQRDWTASVEALFHHRHLGPVTAWAPGYHVTDDQGESTPYVIAAGERSLNFCLFESMKPLMFAERSPALRHYPFARMADWDVMLFDGGRKLVRLLMLDDRALAAGSLEEAMQIPGSRTLLLVGLAATSRADDVVAAIIDGVGRHGAFSPATRAYHPLQIAEATTS